MFKGIKVFFNWLFNDVAPWPTDEDVRKAEEEASLRIAARQQEILSQEKISNGMSKALKGKSKAKPWSHTLQVEITEEELAKPAAAPKKKAASKRKSAAKKTVKSKTKKRK